MKRSIMWLFAVWIVLASAPVVSQAQTTDDDEWADFSEDFLPDVSFKFRHERPVIEPMFMMTTMKHRDLQNTELAELGSIDLRLGFAKKSDNKYSKSLVNYELNYAFLGYGAKSFALSTSAADAIESSVLRFGFGEKKGLGYVLDTDVAIVPYHGGGALWTQFKADPLPADTLGGAVLAPFHDAFRFGKESEAGVLIQFTKNSGVTVGYEFSVVYPRHLFWYWAGSEVVEAIGQGAIDNFVRAISKSSPNAAPVVGFILKNGLSYGLYELRKKNMNWPFNTAPAMSYSAFKVGFNLAF